MKTLIIALEAFCQSAWKELTEKEKLFKNIFSEKREISLWRLKIVL